MTIECQMSNVDRLWPTVVLWIQKRTRYSTRTDSLHGQMNRVNSIYDKLLGVRRQRGNTSREKWLYYTAKVLRKKRMFSLRNWCIEYTVSFVKVDCVCFRSKFGGFPCTWPGFVHRFGLGLELGSYKKFRDLFSQERGVSIGNWEPMQVVKIFYFIFLPME